MTELVKTRNRVKYVDLLVCDNTRGVASATVNKHSKLIYPRNRFCIQAVWGAYRYDAEVQFGSFGVGEPVKKARGVADSVYNRTESGFLPLTLETAELLEGVAARIRVLVEELKQ